MRTLAATSVLVLSLVFSGCSSADEEPAQEQPEAAQLLASELRISSPHFTEIRPRVRIPPRHTCVGEDLSPPLSWSGVPPGTKSLALIADDPDNQTGLWVHWVLYNIPADVTALPEGIPTSTGLLPDGTKQGTNDHKKIGYEGPCPPAQKPPYPGARVSADSHQGLRGDPAHRYFFKLYALDKVIGLAPGATRAELLSAMEGHILAQGQTVGKYLRPPDPFD